jgi:hypothetical protein
MTARRFRELASLAVVAMIATAALTSARARDERRFPHRAHEKLFPTCTGCHAGIVTGVAATTFPSPQACATCHNGTDAKIVEWSGPSRTASNLHFDHVTHATQTDAAGEKLECLHCHGEGAPAAARPWMQVQRAPPAECITCHAHAATTHLASDARCETCHVPLAAAVALSDSAIAGFPAPPSHDDPNWIATHAPKSAAALSQCSTCHARESCARCHVNAATLAPVQALASDARVARLVHGRAPRYPVPPSHRAASFAQGHGALAASAAATCANCHSQSSCQACHLGSMGARVIAKLPRPIKGSAAGVRLEGGASSFGETSSRSGGPSAPADAPSDDSHERFISRTDVQDTTRGNRALILTDTTRPTRVFVHSADFARAHGAAASSGQLNCAGCHQQRFCTSCHQGNGERRYHPFNFASGHASAAFARETSCSSCHNNETFCRACHAKSGIAGAGTARTAGAAHGAQPLWLLQHGQAARQGMQSCAACHQQTDCLRCHSTVTQRVNPHGPDFDPRRMSARNKLVCQYCHIGDPLK